MAGAEQPKYSVNITFSLENPADSNDQAKKQKPKGRRPAPSQQGQRQRKQPVAEQHGHAPPPYEAHALPSNHGPSYHQAPPHYGGPPPHHSGPPPHYSGPSPHYSGPPPHYDSHHHYTPPVSAPPSYYNESGPQHHRGAQTRGHRGQKSKEADVNRLAELLGPLMKEGLQITTQTESTSAAGRSASTQPHKTNQHFRYNDCKYYYSDQGCRKADKCTYRHEPAAIGNKKMCFKWKRGNCDAPHCQYRHANLEDL